MYKLYLLAIALFLVAFTHAQNEAEESKEFKMFRGYIAAGLNVSQIEGDGMGGYTKLGANAGVGTFIMYTPKFSNSVEIGYSMRGAQSKFTNNNPFTFQRYSTDYIQMPVLFNYHNEKFGVFGGGFTPGLLVRTNFYNPVSGFSELNMKPWDLSMTLSYTYIFAEKFAANLNFNYSLSNNLKGSIRRGGWYHNFLSLRFYYLF
jgi:hypothetical protein